MLGFPPQLPFNASVGGHKICRIATPPGPHNHGYVFPCYLLCSPYHLKNGAPSPRTDIERAMGPPTDGILDDHGYCRDHIMYVHVITNACAVGRRPVRSENFHGCTATDAPGYGCQDMSAAYAIPDSVPGTRNVEQSQNGVCEPAILRVVLDRGLRDHLRTPIRGCRREGGILRDWAVSFAPLHSR